MQNSEIAEFFGIKRSFRLKGYQRAAYLYARDQSFARFRENLKSVMYGVTYAKGANDFSNLG